MHADEILIAFLSVAVAFAGFAGIVALIDRRAAHVSGHVVSFRVRFLIIGVNLVIVLSALPFILDAFQVAEHSIWRIACAVLAVSGSGYLFAMIHARSKLTGPQLEGLSARQFNLIVPPGVLCVVAAVGAAAGIIPALGTYVLGDFYFLLGIASLFLRLVLMLDDGARNRDP